MEWQPIAEAPKDGTRVLGRNLKMGIWNDDGSFRMGAPWFVCWHATRIKDGKPYWCILGVGEFFDEKFFPTEFMLIPGATPPNLKRK